jgi:hypothetical protein
MFEVPACPQCGVPTHITSAHTWLGDGAIVQTDYPENRMVFSESENFDPLFKGIEELIGMSIEHIVVDVSRRTALAYMKSIIPEETRDVLRSGRVPPELTMEVTFTLTRILGLGVPSLVDLQFEDKPDDYIVIHYARPLSGPIIAGILAGTVEAYLEDQVGVTYQYVSPDVIEVRAFRSEHPEELKHRLWTRLQKQGPGEIELESCPGCGGPQMLSGYRWDVNQGTIKGRDTGRRMAVVGPSAFDGIFTELESELGEDIPGIVVEAQRRFVRDGFYPASTFQDPMLRQELALRGLGDLMTLEADKAGARVVMKNTVVPLMIVGFMQGLFELSRGLESRTEWELSEDGTLKADIMPWH